MSIWSEMQDRGTGDAVKKEDLAVKIKEISNRILDLVGTHNELVNEVDELDNQVCFKQGLGGWEKGSYSLPYKSDTEVNSILRCGDYGKMKKYYSNLIIQVSALRREKDNLTGRLIALEQLREKETHDMMVKMAEEMAEERRKAEEERKSEQRMKDRFAFMSLPVIGAIIGIYLIVKGFMVSSNVDAAIGAVVLAFMGLAIGIIEDSITDFNS